MAGQEIAQNPFEQVMKGNPDILAGLESHFGPDLAKVATTVAPEVFKQNLDKLLANVLTQLPDGTIDAAHMPLLKSLGIEKVEKHGQDYNIKFEHATKFDINNPLIHSIQFDKDVSFHVGQDPKTGNVRLDNIKGVNADAAVSGVHVAVPVSTIEHEQGQSRFHIASKVLGGTTEIKADVTLENGGKVKVDHPSLKIGGQNIDLSPVMDKFPHFELI